jgi:hypothetical protein
MAKDIDLTWDITPMSGATDIDSLEIFQKSGDHTAETDMAVFRNGATSVATPAKTVSTHTHTGVAAGTYTYGIFSKNQGGYGPGDLINTALVVV